FDTVPDEGFAMREHLVRLFAVEQVQEDRHVVGTETPEGVLVTTDLSEVEPPRIHVVERAELARGEQFLELADAGVVLQQVPAHRSRASGSASQHQASSQPSSTLKLRARFGPQ